MHKNQERFLEPKKKNNLVSREQCDCDSNVHKKLMLGTELPCKHTIRDDDFFEIEFPKLDHKTFLNYNNVEAVESKLDGQISYNGLDSDPVSGEEDFDLSQIKESIKNNYTLMIEHHCKEPLNAELEELLMKIIYSAFEYGLESEKKKNDFVKFLMAELLLIIIKNDGDGSLIVNKKNELIGRYFAFNE